MTLLAGGARSTHGECLREATTSAQRVHQERGEQSAPRPNPQARRVTAVFVSVVTASFFCLFFLWIGNGRISELVEGGRGTYYSNISLGICRCLAPIKKDHHHRLFVSSRSTEVTVVHSLKVFL